MAHCGVSKLLIITTSNSLPPIAVDMVIFARAWFSDSVMNFSLVPGFSFSNSDDSFCASVICELDTSAMVTSFADAPRLPAPAHPAVSDQPRRSCTQRQPVQGSS